MQEVDETEGGEEIEPAQEPQAPTGDPLDEIQDPEELRAEAKKFRSIGQRKAAAPKIEVVATAAPSQTVTATKDDLALLVTNQAKELVSDEIRENWDELIAIPLAGANTLDARSIAKNMEERMTLLKVRKGQPLPENPTAGLTATPGGVRGGSGPTPTATKTPEPPGFRLPTPVTEWYPKKS